MSKNGLHLITPTSIVSTGTGNSSSINANGSVQFSTCATISFNGVFTADYDNYMIVTRIMNNSGLYHYLFRLRASGTDDTTTSSYVSQRLYATGTAIGGSRTAEIHAFNGFGINEQRDGQILYLYGPYLSQPTAYRSVHTLGFLGGYIDDYAGTHNQSVSYDGFTRRVSGGTMTGLMSVYGMRK